MTIPQSNVSVRTLSQTTDLSDTILESPSPIVVKGLVSSWPAVLQGKRSDQALINYLCQFDQNHLLTALITPPESKGRIFYNDDFTGFNFEQVRTTLSKALTQLEAFNKTDPTPGLYIGSTHLGHWLPGFSEDNPLALPEKEPIASIWLGNHSRIAAHFDFPSNLACNVSGHRRVTLFPPEQINNLYVGPLDFTPAGQPISLVDFNQPDWARFPNFKTALEHAMVVDLEPGDGLIIPSMWWHHIEATEPLNVLVNFWWRSSSNFLGSPLNVLQHALLGLRDLPEHQREIWKGLLNHYVFDFEPDSVAHVPENARGILNPLDSDTAQRLKTMLRNQLN
ncbi:MAG: cupin-like domain-containing protein [Pseudomonadales bacterium]